MFDRSGPALAAMSGAALAVLEPARLCARGFDRRTPCGPVFCIGRSWFEAGPGFLPSVLSRRPDLGSARPDTPFGERHNFSVVLPKLDLACRLLLEQRRCVT